jgi:seryl-tRNA synthetase
MLAKAEYSYPSVPAGRSADDNVEGGAGERPAFSFQPKRIGIWGQMGILDLSAPRITGARFGVLGLGAKLSGPHQFHLMCIREHGYTEVLPPFMINSASGCRAIAKFAEDLFKIENTDYWLLRRPVPLTNLYRDERSIWTDCRSSCAPTRRVSSKAGSCAMCADHPPTSFRKSSW